MSTLNKLLAVTGLLIALYLFLKNSKATTSIIAQLGSTYTGGVKVLQGR